MTLEVKNDTIYVENKMVEISVGPLTKEEKEQWYNTLKEAANKLKD